MISVLQTAESQKCYHVTRIFEPWTKANGPGSGPKKSACPRTSETDSMAFTNSEDATSNPIFAMICPSHQGTSFL